jgi:hypothetical protein
MKNLSCGSRAVTRQEIRQNYRHVSETFQCKCGKQVTALILVNNFAVRQNHENCTYYNSSFLNNMSQDFLLLGCDTAAVGNQFLMF